MVKNTTIKYPIDDKWFYEDSKYENIYAPLTTDTVIYKFIKLDYFILMLKNKKIRLEKIISWDDPFENLILKCECVTKNNIPISLDNLKNSIYGTCFSEIDESDAFWRIYSPNQDGVRLKTTVGKFFDYLYGDGFTNSGKISMFFKQVEYVEENNFLQIIKDPTLVKEQIFKEKPNEAVFMKRKAFSHENEVRFIYSIATDHHDFGKDYVEFDVDVNDIFDEVTEDPRLNDSEFEKVKSQLETYGFKGEINKSSLYGAPNYKMIIDLDV